MAGLGIYDYGARFYSPKLGRFLSADTIVPGAANPQAFNRYSYVLNNPIRYNDPTGHMCSDPDDHWGNGCDGSGTPPPTTPLPTTPLPNPGSGDNDDDEDLAEELSLVYDNNDSLPTGIPADPPVPSYCGGGPNGLYDVFDCGATFTQDLALVIDTPFAGVELIFLAIGCPLGGLKGCAAGAKVGQTFFKYTGANRGETALSFFSMVLSIAADAADEGITGIDENSVTAIDGVIAGTWSKDPILDFIIDGYGSAYNHEFVNGVFSFIPFDSYPLIR